MGADLETLHNEMLAALSRFAYAKSLYYPGTKGFDEALAAFESAARAWRDAELALEQAEAHEKRHREIAEWTVEELAKVRR
jgi:hypothetical protein